jgi:aldehyde:ferredoxin oxidoreductase
MLGYRNVLLRVNLSDKTITRQELSHEFMDNWLGGTGLGVKLLYDEVPVDAAWDSPDNKLYMSCGALTGMPAGGSGTYGVVTKGALTGGIATSQANGSFGALLKYAGYIGIVFEGQSDDWVYLYIDGDTVELKDATHLKGLGSLATQDKLHEEYDRGEYQMSVACIGQAGENLVRFAMITGDYGHVAAHNGVGAVLGSKRVKAVAINKNFNMKSDWADYSALKQAGLNMAESAKEAPTYVGTLKWGTNDGFVPLYKGGVLPIKNLNTSIMEEAMDFQRIRDKYEYHHKPCWGCQWTHCGVLKFKDGPHKGKVVEEPEYEALAGLGTDIFSKDIEGSLLLTELIDDFGMDCNESGWLMAFIIDAYENGYITDEQTDGIAMKWGDPAPVGEMLTKIAHREGCGDFWAEGIKRCAESLGGEAQKVAVYTLKGNTPRGHDHRADWKELLDICCSSTGTVEVVGGGVNVKQYGEEPMADKFDPMEVARYNAIIAGRRVMEDSVGLCRMASVEDIHNTVDALTAATGDEWTIDKAMNVGRRITNLMRLYNLRSGLTVELEEPSFRYGSRPLDGPNEGREIRENFFKMRARYFELMGWDPATGVPKPETFTKYKMDEYIEDLKAIS